MESATTDGKSGNSVRRIPVTGIAGGATDKAIVYLPTTLPVGGGPIDVLLHLHGHPAGGPGGYLGGATDTDVTDPGTRKSSRPSPQADDIDEYRIGAQLAAAGRPMVAILPQGIGKSDFGAGRSRVFDADAYIASTFSRLTAIGAFPAVQAPTPGPVVLSGHSGADKPISDMLSSSVAPDNLAGLFLFDTMYPKAGYVEKIWAYVRGRLEQEWSDLQSLAGGAAEQDADAAGPGRGPQPASAASVLLDQLNYLRSHGFRLFNVHGGGTYQPQSRELDRQITRWFRQSRVRHVVGGADSPVLASWMSNFEIIRSADRAKGVHMRILRYGNHLKRAVDLLPQRLAVTADPVPTAARDVVTPTPSVAASGTAPEELIAEASARIRTAVLAAAAPFVGTPEAADLPGMLTMQIISGKPDPRKRLKADNPMRPLYDVLWDAAVVDDLRIVDDPSWSRGSRKQPKKAEGRRRALLTDLLSSLMPSSAAGAATSAPMTPLDRTAEIATEKGLVSPALLTLTTDGSWEKIRTAILVKFGGLVDGPRTAIERANAYYGSLVPAKFLNSQGRTVVHPDLQAALTRAETHLRPQLAILPTTEVDAITAAVRKLYSTVIRPNQNAQHKLSDHSFGWAIDVDAAHNPNIGKGAGLAAVGAVTGRNPRNAATAGRTADQVLATATDLRQISRDYVAAMSDDASLAPVLARLANEGRSAARLPALDPSVATALVAAVRINRKGERATSIRGAVWPEGAALSFGSAGKGKKAGPPAPPDAVAAAIATIQAIGDAYRTSYGKKGKRIAAGSEGTAGSVAAHGFLNLPPALVAALCGSDAGGLTWLGTVNQDYMHFELRTEPVLY